MLVVMSTCNQEERRPSYRKTAEQQSLILGWRRSKDAATEWNWASLTTKLDKHPRHSPLRTRGRFFAGWDGETRWRNEIYKKVRTGNQNPTTGEANLRCGLTARHIHKPNRTKTKADNTKPTMPKLWPLHVPPKPRPTRTAEIHLLTPPRNSTRCMPWCSQTPRSSLREGISLTRHQDERVNTNHLPHRQRPIIQIQAGWVWYVTHAPIPLAKRQIDEEIWKPQYAWEPP